MGALARILYRTSSLLLPVYILIILFLIRYSSAVNNNYLYPQTTQRLRLYTFVLTEGTLQPDNYKQIGYLINGHFPGPPIFCNQFDFLQVKVVNKMSVPVTIHFHGLLQAHTVAADGVPLVTQEPIPPYNGTYTYDIQIGLQTGTFMYHGHMDFDIVFIYGALIIRDNPSYWNALGVDYHYEMGYEHHFVLSEVYHYPLHQFLLDVTGKWVGKPPIKSYTINGLSYGKWDKNNGNATGYEIIKVVPGKTYRFRVINVAADSLLRWKIEGHRLRVIEMDGILAFPVWTNHLEINSGQRYSVLVTMDKTIDNYWIQSEKIGGPGPGPDNGRAILSYVGASDPTRMQKLVFPNVTQSIKATSWVLPQLQPNRLLAQTEVYKLDPFKKSDRKIKVDTHMVFNDKGERVFLINGHAFKKPEKALLTQVRQGIDISKTDPLIFEVIQDEIVDIIFQNRVIEQGPCIQHPIHLHGHSFYIVAEGPDVVDTSKLDDIIHKNLLNRVVQFRDTFTMFPYQIKENTTSGAGCGWTVIRFLANNPGIWLSHCHITTHMLIKKLFVIYEYSHDNPRLYNE